MDCINKPKDLIDKAIELGLSGIAITDHECLSAHMEINQYAQEIRETHPDFKIALGNEIYLVDERKNGQKYYHFILIAKDKIGHQQLCELSSGAWYNSYTDKGMTRVPTTKEELRNIVEKNPGHIIADSACLGGELPTLVISLIEAEKHGDEENILALKTQIHNFIIYCKNLFGEDFYLEVAPAESKDQILFNQRIVSIAKAYQLKIVVGSDAHYLTKKDRYVHKAYLNSKEGEREIDSFYEYTYLMDVDEATEHLTASYEKDFIEEIFQNTIELQNKIENYFLQKHQSIPEVEVIDYPKGNKYKVNSKYSNLCFLLDSDNIQERYWINQCLLALQDKGLLENAQYLERLEEEARVKKIIGEKLQTCMFAYPNTLQHYIDLFWRCGSPVGAGRGSSCSALNHYLLGITQLDPIEWNLPFFRYLNEARTEIGDIDLDLAPSKLNLIFEEIRKERGELGLVQVCTFGTESTKSCILSSCFKKGSKILTKNGKINIEDVTPEDEVWTINGWEKVLCPTYIKNKTLIRLKTRNSTDDYIDCTPDHEFLTISKCHKGRINGTFNKKDVIQYFPEFQNYHSQHSVYQRVYGYWRNTELKWKRADLIDDVNDYGVKKIDLNIDETRVIPWKNDFLRNFGTGISQEIPINAELCELIGIWLAEGSSNGQQITFTIHQKEENFKNRIIELMWKIFNLDNYGIYPRKDSLALNISYSSKQLIKFFEQLFEVDDIRNINQWNKYIPKKLLHIQPELQMQIFKGWFIGDGWAANPELKNRNEAKGVTVSQKLADDIIFILNRNFINPFVQKEERAEKAKAYNIMFYQNKAKTLYHMKYQTTYKDLFQFQLEDRTEMDFPMLWNGEYYLKVKLEHEANIKENLIKQQVYCLQVPSQSFTLNDTIVHNCRGYRSEEYPDGIDVDEAQFISSLVPVERGFSYSLSDLVYGNKEKDRKPNKTFIAEVERFPGLLDIMFGIENLVCRRGIHASGVILFDDKIFESAAIMRAPNGALTTQWDLHSQESAGSVKYDFLLTAVQDIIIQTIQLLRDNNQIEKDLSLREIYNKYLHPNVLPRDDPKMWNALANNEVLCCFQFDSPVGAQAAKKIQPKTPLELADANGLMRLMPEDGGETPIDKYVRFKNNIKLWYKEMADFGLTEREQKILEPYFRPSYGVPPSQEQLMQMLMDENICGFTLAEANTARKVVGKFLAV